MHLVSGQGDGPIRIDRDSRLSRDQLFDALMRLADSWQSRWDRRRHLEWTITFGIWAVLIVAFVAADYGASLPLAMPALIFLAHACIVTQMRVRNERDSVVVLQLRREAEGLAHHVHILPDRVGGANGWRSIARALLHYSLVAQLVPTALGVFMLSERLWNFPAS